MATLPDSEIEKMIHDRLQRAGASLDQIRPLVDQGNVKLIGTLKHEGQRRTYLKVVSTVDGVKRVDDQLLVETRTKR